MSDFIAAPILAELKGFQRDAVAHAMHRLFDASDSSRRFLIADETGLGKSVIARGVIAETIERLQYDPSVERIDIVYVCSNADLASQNLRRLNVTGDPHIGLTSRLTLLAKESHRLGESRNIGRKPVNLISFTPGTSFDIDSSPGGSADERALLHIILSGHCRYRDEKERASRILFQGAVQKEETFQRRVDEMRSSLGSAGPDPEIVRSFIELTRDEGVLDEYRDLVNRVRRAGHRRDEDRSRTNAVHSRLRAALATASVDALSPDLVILDEFQRFRGLLDSNSDNPAAELANSLFEHPDAHVLLLSATPYKAYTAKVDGGEDDHYEDLMRTLEFLSYGSPEALTRIRSGFSAYRAAILSGSSGSTAANELSSTLTNYMSRTERPSSGSGDMVRERRLQSGMPSAAELAGYVGLDRLATSLDAPIGIEYWKSIPYFANFMDGYKVASALDRHRDEGGVTGLANIPTLDRETVESFGAIEPGNGHLKALAAEVLDAGWWRLLWMPASMPYFTPGPVYSSVDASSVSKRVVFSAWTGTPTAIAALLSYEADRRIAEGSRMTGNTPADRKSVSGRLEFRITAEGRAASMSTLALFWPHPALAQAGDPLSIVRSEGSQIAPADALMIVESRVGAPTTEPEAWRPWEMFFRTPGAIPAGVRPDPALFIRERDDDAGENSGRIVRAHLERALETMAEGGAAFRHPDLARLAVHSPGNIAYRALGRLRDTQDGTTDAGHWRAAARLAHGIRSLFNRTETMLLLDKITPSDEEAYWQVVLDYCADGNLQAVLDEYLFQLRSESAGTELDDDQLAALAARAVDAITMRPSTYQARGLADRTERIPFSARFALRYGGRAEGEESNRQPEVRNAFNSPFWPFVLASTSVGQEGIDFHWWSHAVVHWNVPSNPVDFEQREGRVNRFAGHAVRKNVAAAHAADVFASDDPNPWKAAFSAASGAHPELGEFAPYWVYPGDAKIERILAAYPLSKDVEKIRSLKEALTLYRLTLGQPRQEDMLELLRQREVDGGEVAVLDLRPPAAG